MWHGKSLTEVGCYCAVAESGVSWTFSGTVFPGQSTPNLGFFIMLRLFSFPVATVSHAGGSRLTVLFRLQGQHSVRVQAPDHGTLWGWTQGLNPYPFGSQTWWCLGAKLSALDSAPGDHHTWALSWSSCQHWYLTILFSLSLLRSPVFLLPLCRCPGWRRTCNSRWLPATVLDALK